MIKYCFSYLFNLLKMLIERKFYQADWFIQIMYHDKTIVLKQNHEGFWADPFLYETEDTLYVFFENFNPELNRGIISCISINLNTDIVSQAIDVLIEPYHLSYPLVFEENGIIYMLPETKNANEIRLYKCERFPNEWQLVNILIKDIKAVDTNLIKKDNLYWLICTCQTSNISNSSDVMKIFYSSKLDGEWLEHEQNPIKMNATASRNAGNIFIDNNRWIRPVQNHQFGYGKNIDFYAIEELSTTSYSETLVKQLKNKELNKNAKGIHTYNKSKNALAIDVILNK